MKHKQPVTIADGDAATTKACCAQLYSSDWAGLLLGDSFHPGGLPLTTRLAERMAIAATDRVLDVAAGRGSSAIHLARTIGCHVVGIDLATENVAQATTAALAAGVERLCTFLVGDAEGLDLDDASFDAIICECSFCTFPNKQAAVAEFVRLLRSGGCVGLTDVTRTGPLRPELAGLLAWVACVADAQPAEQYAQLLRDEGLTVDIIEPQDDALATMVTAIRSRLAAGQVLSVLRAINVDGWDFDNAAAMTRCVTEEIQAGHLGYTLITASK